jgi:hypothetical protein
MRPNLLHVIAVSFNPRRFKSHVNNYAAFEKHMLESGVHLTVVECAYGDIPHQFANNDGINHVPVYAKNPIWVKENAINLGIASLPRDWKYVAWIDADVVFENPNWAEDTVYALQHYDFVQPWEHCLDLGPSGSILEMHHSFCRQWAQEPKTCSMLGKSGYRFAHPGYAWAATRSALEATGGLIQTAVLGSGDHHQALCLIGKAELSFPKGVTEGYKAPILRWQDRCNKHINGNISYVPGTIRHLYHGQKRDRAYQSRWDILVKHKFDPYEDLKTNTSGIYELVGNKPELKRDIMSYFSSRQEDWTLL